MGSGKSTIAAELSRMLHRPVLEMDEEIEKREGMSIPAIFSEHGEAYFRQLETDLLKETSALGGFSRFLRRRWPPCGKKMFVK